MKPRQISRLSDGHLYAPVTESLITRETDLSLSPNDPLGVNESLRQLQ